MITIVDYGMGNLGSIANMLKHVGADSTIASEPASIAGADKLILPGVGSFDAAMKCIDADGLRDALNECALRRRVPVLGICLGMHLLTQTSEEGRLQGLCWIDATVGSFRGCVDASLKVPHMGWNGVKVTTSSPLTRGLDEDARFYFVHSYFVACRDVRHQILETTYGIPFAAAIQQDNIFGVQFHPEKSHRFGIARTKEFCGFVMLRTRVIPCLLLRGDSLVKTVRFRKPTYVGDPVNTVRIFNELEVDELMIIDITASRTGTAPNHDLMRAVADQAFMPVGCGGGVRDVESAERLLQIGFEKVLVNSAALERPALLTELATRFGSQSVVVAIDAARRFGGGYRVTSLSGTRKWPLQPLQWAREAQERGAGEILLTSIEREGTWQGFDLELTAQVANGVSIPVIAHGGASAVADIHRAVKQAGASAVALGSMVVFQRQGMGVLVNFPDSRELQEALA